MPIQESAQSAKVCTAFSQFLCSEFLDATHQKRTRGQPWVAARGLLSPYLHRWRREHLDRQKITAVPNNLYPQLDFRPRINAHVLCHKHAKYALSQWWTGGGTELGRCGRTHSTDLTARRRMQLTTHLPQLVILTRRQRQLSRRTRLSSGLRSVISRARRRVLRYRRRPDKTVAWSDKAHRPDDGGIKHLWNVGKLVPGYNSKRSHLHKNLKSKLLDDDSNAGSSHRLDRSALRTEAKTFYSSPSLGRQTLCPNRCSVDTVPPSAEVKKPDSEAGHSSVQYRV
jgi:hypothetical protein